MELPTDVVRGDAALVADKPEEAQAHYLRQIALALTDLASITIHVHEVHTEGHAKEEPHG